MPDKSAYHIRPEVLAFMRKSSGMSEDEIAKKLKLSKSRYINIENGTEPISQILLIHLADVYKRPLIAFYSPGLIQVPELPHDYRLNRDKELSPEIFFAKRKALYLAEQLKEITGKQTSLPSIDLVVSAKNLAERVRTLLQVDFDFIKELTEEPIINYYKSLIEEIFFIPIIEHPLKTNGVRAFSVYSDVCVMVLNESDSKEVKLFSLFHEFCHLLKRQDGICTIDFENDNQPEERYCDEFAAILLMPEIQLKKEISIGSISSLSHINHIAKKFGVSQHSMLIRMKELNIINLVKYNNLKKELDAKKGGGFGRRNWEQTYIKRTSRLVLSNLVDSYKKGDLTYSSLLTITGIKDKYLQKFI